MISGHTLAKNLRQWGVVFGSGLAGFALGVILFSLYGLDGIFHALNTVPIAAGVGLSLVLALAFMAGGALFALAQERWRNLLARIALNNMTQGLCMFDSRRPARPVQRALHRDVRFAARAVRGRHADARTARPRRRGGRLRRRSRTLCRRMPPEGAPRARTDTKTFEMKDGRIISVDHAGRCPAAAGWTTHTDVTRAARRREGARLAPPARGAPRHDRCARSPRSAPASKPCSSTVSARAPRR